MNFKIEVAEKDLNLRIDKFLSNSLPDYSRMKIKELIEENQVTFNNKIINKGSFVLKDTGEIFISLPEIHDPYNITPKDISINIVFEDEHLLIINKQSGLTVHPGNGSFDDTLVNALVYYLGDNLSKAGGEDRPGIVHRLDKDTSGLMIVAKHNKSHRKLAKMIQNRELTRKYKALVYGTPFPKHGTIKQNIIRSKKDRTKMAISRDGGREAITHYKTLEQYGDFASLVECKLETGRTHQIRVHMTHIGNSIIGDKTYKSPNNYHKRSNNLEVNDLIKTLNRQALHSYYLAFDHPITEEFLEFSTELPEDLAPLKKKLEEL